MSQLPLFSEPTEEWNPIYVAYAKAHGRSPEAMLAHDRERWPGGAMAGFMIWNSKRLAPSASVTTITA